MDITTYNWLWEKIEKQIADIESSLDSKEKRKFHFKIIHGSKTKQVLLDEYNAVKKGLKTRCYSNETGIGESDNLIDYHKIAACFCCALINKKVFSFKIEDDIQPKMLMSNYILAYHVSIMIIYYCLLAFYIESPNYSKQAQDLRDARTLFTPHTSHESYNEGRIKVLANNDFYGIGFNILTYSDMLFWLEHFTRQNLENNIDIKPFPFNINELTKVDGANNFNA